MVYYYVKSVSMCYWMIFKLNDQTNLILKKHSLSFGTYSVKILKFIFNPQKFFVFTLYVMLIK